MRKIPPTDLLLNPDGSIYHLKLKPHDIAQLIILVGDPGRVNAVSAFFDRITVKKENREFHTRTGYYRNHKISVISTGIGTDNIDIVMNELDALVNIDLKKRRVKEKHTPLAIVRIGTSGALQAEIPIGSYVVSEYGLGFDGLLNFYKTPPLLKTDIKLFNALKKHLHSYPALFSIYLAGGNQKLIAAIGKDMFKGITATAPGFYGPQGRKLRLKPSLHGLIDTLARFSYRYKNNNRPEELKITNFEMETSALYGLGKLLGHKTCTACAIIGNRLQKQYKGDYHRTMDRLIHTVLDRIAEK